VIDVSVSISLISVQAWSTDSF